MSNINRKFVIISNDNQDKMELWVGRINGNRTFGLSNTEANRFVFSSASKARNMAKDLLTEGTWRVEEITEEVR